MAKPSKPFRFKQFTVEQDKCAMKIGTDGVTLGAWFKGLSPGRLLDIGCGTGVISLMIAQRHPKIEITALEIDRDAFEQAKSNVIASPWEDQVEVIHQDFNNYHPKHSFEYLISNPPFYKGETLPPLKNRAAARHSGELTVERLLSHAENISSANARFCLIWPMDREKELMTAIDHSNWNVHRQCELKSNPNKDSHRMMLELSKQKGEVSKETLTIETLTRHEFTQEYEHLLKDYLTIF